MWRSVKRNDFDCSYNKCSCYVFEQNCILLRNEKHMQQRLKLELEIFRIDKNTLCPSSLTRDKKNP